MITNSYYWLNKDKRANEAASHYNEAAIHYREEIEQSIQDTVLYDEGFAQKVKKETPNNPNMQIILAPMGGVEAIMKYHEGKTAVLNFASYKNPGGGFLAGSRAQEECLCHASTLYNVLRQHQDFYTFNHKHLNYGLYEDRALYTPGIIFYDKNKNTPCDVITCAAPNMKVFKEYGWEKVVFELSDSVLKKRIKFVLDIAVDQNIDTLILGAYGCGVFGNDPEQVAQYFCDYLSTTHHCFKKVVFAVPANMHQENYRAFRKILNKNNKEK